MKNFDQKSEKSVKRIWENWENFGFDFEIVIVDPEFLLQLSSYSPVNPPVKPWLAQLKWISENELDM